MIEVIVRMPDVARLTVEVWETSLYEQLRKGGIPVEIDGTLKNGSLVSFNDPKDFGAMIYRWSPDSGAARLGS